MITLNPYLGFRGNAREAMEFYQSVLGGALTLSTFAELQAAVEPEENDLIMHAQLTTDGGLVLMGSDTPRRMDYNAGDTIAVSLSGDDELELTGYYDGLIEGGTVLQPLTKAAWGDSFGMFVDRFGVRWLVNISAPAA
jgi:PhnB protein